MVKLDQYVSRGLQNTVRVVRAPGLSEDVAVTAPWLVMVSYL